MKDEEIMEFLVQYDYDVRKTNNARWIDQKCTPDVLYVIADCILNYVYSKNDENIIFTAKDIWDFEYSAEIIFDYFNKVPVSDESASSEYDKFFAMPLKLFGYSGILVEKKVGRRNFYNINNFDLLKYISLNERFAYKFLVNYIPKVLKDTEIYDLFDNFLTSQSIEDFNKLKHGFYKFTVENTPINGHLEVNRIFPKVINPLACYQKKLGTSKGYRSRQIISFSELRYNGENFRDVYAHKPKTTSRQDWEKTEEYQIRRKSVSKIINRETARAKKILHEYNCKYRGCYSEVCDGDRNKATQAHHIFPKSSFPKISDYFENLILLTPNQHNLKAHPNNHTHEISVEYQRFMLLEKTNRINESILNDSIETIFSFDKLVEVINEGFNKDYEVVDNSFKNSISIINECYSEIL